MKYKVKRVHFVGMGGADTSGKQGPVTIYVTGCDRPRVAPAAVFIVALEQDETR